jgi:hypothetical protein
MKYFVCFDGSENAKHAVHFILPMLNENDQISLFYFYEQPQFEGIIDTAQIGYDIIEMDRKQKANVAHEELKQQELILLQATKLKPENVKIEAVASSGKAHTNAQRNAPRHPLEFAKFREIPTACLSVLTC